MRTEHATGIYAIRHTESGKVYVGSAKSFDARWRVHRCLLRKGAHHSPYLQAAWNKHGEQSFVFEKLLVCKPEHMFMYEQILVDGMKAADREHGYNAASIVTPAWNLGKTASPETRAKISAARAKQVFSDETRALWSKNRKGRKMPEGFGEFTRSHRLGFKHTDQAKAKISAAQRGSTHSLERIEARSKITLEIAERIRATYRAGGVKQSEVAKQFSVDQGMVSLIVSGKRWPSRQT